ncbi:MAG: carboxymuconolactone decarboxylase family protein [Stenotrophomonas sp.]|nr:carboxymuconolactone decarboxylase family protein [Stenotrophomonas sp.]
MLEAYQALGAAAAHDQALDPKTRELIAVAVAISLRCDGCIGTHTEAARKAGATEEELAQALATAIQVNAGAAYVYSMRALEAYGE